MSSPSEPGPLERPTALIRDPSEQLVTGKVGAVGVPTGVDVLSV